ncbi:Rab GTPase-activating protein 1-like [Toxocara canis]|uniref:Rab GTPase-activating protein 1-like n=1 Tax=Toxocara canis TaxID=6265 RepID=A0A0B2V4P5_TOXCA|nr:Rab GTPase-activating protein 1-like [Toxocara canis]
MSSAVEDVAAKSDILEHADANVMRDAFAASVCGHDETLVLESDQRPPNELRRCSLSFENLHSVESSGEATVTGTVTAASFGGSSKGDDNDNKMTPISPESLTNTAIMEQICYLGCAKISNPSSEPEMVKIMRLLNKERAQNPIDVILSIPDSALGIVRMFDGASKTEMVSFPVHRIRFCARGQLDSAEKECFALSFTQQNATATDPALHHCHVFRCQVPEAAGKALLCFANAFRNNNLGMGRKPSSPSLRRSSRHGSNADGDTSSMEGIFTPGGEEDYQFDAFLEMKEEDPKKGFTICPQEKNCFKLRRDREKRVVVVLQQTAGPKVLSVKKCFGMLLAAGRNLRQSDMHLLDMQSMGRGNDSRTYIIEAIWDPHAQNFEVLNTETPRETRVFMTVAVDVILTGIDEPVRFNMECKARIFHEHERFWYVTRRPIVEKYFLTVKMASGEDAESSEAESSSPKSNGLQVSGFHAFCYRGIFEFGIGSHGHVVHSTAAFFFCCRFPWFLLYFLQTCS